MSIRKGLRFGDDDDAPVASHPHQYGATGFNADRNRTNFEKDVDSLLFGDTRPPPRGRKPKAAETTETIPPQKPKQIQQKPAPTLEPKVDIKKPEQKQDIKKPEPVVNKKKDNYVSEEKPEPPKQKQVIEEQPMNERKKDTEEVVANVNNLLFFNRPSYIRKLKKVAEDFNFATENQESHRFIDVLRPSECQRSLVKKFNYPNFEDHEFPPNSLSVGKSAKKDEIEWRKPAQVFKAPVFGKYVDPNDIQPGSWSSPQFLSTLCCLAERQENIKRLIEDQKINQNGFYYVRINVNGVWRYMAVDDHLPESNGVPIGARSFNDSQSELWVSLIEKAYAKVYHGYSVFQKTTSREHYLRDLTGAPVRKCEPSQADFNDLVNQALTLGWPVMAVPSQRIVELGFNPNYSLSVLRSTSKGLELRSSWGTIIERSKVNLSREGVFELSSSQVSDFISHIIFAQTDAGIRTSTIQSKHWDNFYSCYSFKLSKPNPNATISISQLDKRLFSELANYEYVPFRLILEKKNVDDGDSHSIYVNSAFSFKSRNLDLAVNLTPGLYYIYIIGSWGGVHYDYDLTIFANELVQITKIYHASFPNLIAQALTEECLSKGKRSAKGNVDEYILYHEPSNLVLITALSLVDRAYNYTLNLQQVKPETLSLLNVVKPEENFAKKLRSHIKEYKESVFEQKNWEVNLLPHQKYTWVFSSSQDYDPGNFKSWGFK